MSNISQFMASAGVEIGQQLSMPGALNNFTIGTKEFLRCGFMKAYTSAYSVYKTRVPYGAFVDVVPLSKNLSYSVGTNVGVYHNGTRYQLVGANNGAATNTTYHSTDGITWTASSILGATNSATYSHCKIGNTLILTLADATNPTIQYSSDFQSWNYASGIAAGVGVGSVAANVSGNLAVAIVNGQTNTTASSIYTSTTGISWTARTGTGGQAIAIMRGVHWSPCASAFLIAGTTGTNGADSTNFLVNKTTDGYTQTTSLTDSSTTFSTSEYGIYHQLFVASSPTVTLYSCNNGRLKRTTNGTSWTTVELSAQTGMSNIGLSGTQARIYYDSVSAKFYAYIPYVNSSTLAGSNLFSSSDGITWVQTFMFRDASTTYPATALATIGVYGVWSANSKSIIPVNISAAIKGIADVTSALTATNPNWVGMLIPADSSQYVRIA